MKPGLCPDLAELVTRAVDEDRSLAAASGVALMPDSGITAAASDMTRILA
ncbi:MAG: hypothetical protein ACYDB8_02795 [Acidiferrobacterales bacterium]